MYIKAASACQWLHFQKQTDLSFPITYLKTQAYTKNHYLACQCSFNNQNERINFSQLPSFKYFINEPQNFQSVILAIKQCVFTKTILLVKTNRLKKAIDYKLTWVPVETCRYNGCSPSDGSIGGQSLPLFITMAAVDF